MRNRFGISRGEPLAELLSRLVAPAPAWSQPKLADDHVLLVALETLAELGDERAVPYLVMALVTGDGIDTAIAARALERLMPRDLAGLALLETKVRDRGWYGYDGWWPNDRPQLKLYVEESAARSALQRGLSTAALGLLSMNANGRVRELAVRGLAAVDAGDELPFLVLRANDWVPEVSSIARRAIERRCTPENAAAFVAVLPLVERLRVQRRVDKSELVEKIETMLVGSANGIESLGAATAGASDVSVRRAVARLAHARTLPLQRIESAVSDRDAVVRTQFALAVAQRGTSEQLARWLPRLFADKAPRIRSIAFRAAESRLPALLDQALTPFLFDGNFWLREFARQKLTARGHTEFARVYGQALEHGDASRVRGAIAGLSEVGSATDAPLVLPYMSRGSSQIRQAAIRAVCSLLKQEAVPHLLNALASELGGVSKVAAELLRSRNLAVVSGELAPSLRSPLPHVRANALAVLAANDRWEALITSLECLTDADERVALVARSILAFWCYFPPNLYSRPTADQRERLRAALRATPAGAPVLSQLVHTIAENG
jgi:HEAT repeat protein